MRACCLYTTVHLQEMQNGCVSLPSSILRLVLVLHRRTSGIGVTVLFCTCSYGWRNSPLSLPHSRKFQIPPCGLPKTSLLVRIVSPWGKRLNYPAALVLLYVVFSNTKHAHAHAHISVPSSMRQSAPEGQAPAGDWAPLSHRSHAGCLSPPREMGVASVARWESWQVCGVQVTGRTNLAVRICA